MNSPLDTSLFDRAARLAIEAHGGTERRGKGFPYILHPMEAATIAATITSDPEVLAAAVLHDTVEDTAVTVDELRRLFGPRVAALVHTETAPAGLSWRAKREHQVARIAAADRDSKIVALSDKLSNLRTIALDHLSLGDALWSRFHAPEGKKDIEWYYRALASSLASLADTAAYLEFTTLLEKVFQKQIQSADMPHTDYPQIDLGAWRQVGEGGNGKTYVNADRPEVILKVNTPRLSTFDAVKREYDVSRAAAALGLPTPAMHEIVRLGDSYATIAQLIKPKRSLSRICCDEPGRIEEMARLLCRRGKEMFALACDTAFFPSRKQQLLKALTKVQFVGRRRLATLTAFARSIPEPATCVHGDFQMGNLILSADRHYWIDLDRFGYGDPMFDIGHLFLVCNVYAPLRRVQEIFHMTPEQFRRFWDAFAREYTGQEDHADFDLQAGRFACLDIVTRYFYSKIPLAEKIFFAINIRRLYKRFFHGAALADR